METNQTSASGKKIFIACIIALILLNIVTGVFLFTTNQHKEEITVAKQEVEHGYTKLETDYHSVTALLDAASAEIGQLKGRNAELDKFVEEKQQMIEQEKKQLEGAFRKNKLTAEALNSARELILKYENSIAELEKKVGDYAQQNTKLSSDLTNATENNVVLASKNDTLTQKLTTASFLEIPKVEVEGVKKNLLGKEISVKRVKAAESLKISFETGANKALEPGNLSLYVRIINPKGETISVKEQGSGIITADNQKEVQFTKKADINYQQKNRKVTLYWTRYIEDPGTYKVEVYQSGKVVGKGAVKLV